MMSNNREKLSTVRVEIVSFLFFLTGAFTNCAPRPETIKTIIITYKLRISANETWNYRTARSWQINPV